jgi:AbrB family looped-hinge helix DNA binding protein
VDKQGRIIIPIDLRKTLGLEPNSDLVAFIENDQLVLRPRQAVEQDLWRMFGGVEESLSRDLIRERGAEAKGEH